MDIRDHRHLIEYPCAWTFKVIGSDEELLRAGIREVLGEHAHEVVLSRRSAQANFVSLEVRLRVESEAMRLRFYEGLHAHEHTRIVL